MTRATLPILLALLVFLAAPVALRADTLYLKNGNKFEGKLIKETATHYIFKTRFGEQKFDKSKVLRVEKGESVFDQFSKKWSAVSKDDPDALCELGAWCEGANLRKEAKKCYRAAVDADPDHSAARAALGYVLYRGEWVTKRERDQRMEAVAEKEAAILAGLKQAKATSNAEARFSIKGPAGWEKEEDDGTRIVWRGPELGDVPVVITFEWAGPEDSLDDYVKAVRKANAKAHEGLVKRGEPVSAKLGGKDAKLIAAGWTVEDLQPWTVGLERRDLVMTCTAGSYILSIVCADGYFERLKPFFDKVAGSMKVLAEAPDLQEPDLGFSLAYPDDTYEKGEGALITLRTQRGQAAIAPVEGSVFVRGKTSRVFFIVRAGKKGDGGADTTSLQTLRDGIVNLLNARNFIQSSGGDETTRLDGEEALKGTLSIAGGNLGSGYWLTVMHGDRYFQIVFLNLMNQMGPRYFETDWKKFIDGFRFTD